MKATIEIKNIPFEVEYNFTKGRNAILYGENCHPAESDTIEVLSVIHKDTDFYEIVNIEDVEDAIAIIEEKNNSYDYSF